MRNKVAPHPVYENLISKLLNGERLPQDMALQDSLYVHGWISIFLIADVLQRTE